MAAVLTPDEIRERTRSYLTTSLARELADDEDIFAAGFVNSLFAAQLVTFVEDRFGITVENDELELAHFSSVDAVTAFVTGKTGGAR
ncbi:phosphopantetheine-binding protein [Kitasatospora sp. NPDC002227]|uniref:acyl carrier protein n=1 Tax=Kitasatospora sp. NPDC002227 TaxID=3154773 RepID=UPI00332E59D7